jgi:hypothetical protein
MSNVKIELKEKGPDRTKEDVHRGDTVLWQNITDSPRTITFNQWPFVEPLQNIAIDAKAKSPEFTISDAVIARGYSYDIQPPLDPNGPPDQPSINVGD